MSETGPPAEITDPAAVATWSDLPDREPTGARVAGVDLVVVRYDDAVSVLYGRCQHRGVLLSDGHVDGENLICGVHGWDYRYDTGISEYDNSEQLETFTAWVDENDDAATPRVEITARTPTIDGGVVELTIADNGPGIPTDEKEVLLDGEETPLKHGSGLGLWIVNWIITRTGGRISFERNEPRGSRVTLAVPPAE